MALYGLPILYALLVWWLSTGVVLYLNRLPRRTYRWSLLGASVLLVFALSELLGHSQSSEVRNAYLAFTYAVLIWGWLEMSYFMGLITGPHKHPCPVGSSNWQRFVLAVQVSLYHELVVVALAGLIVWLAWGQPNQVGTWTFLVLWWMRWSAKLNLFFGVPNLNEDWLPEHLRLLVSFIKKKPINLLFPLSVTVATVVVALLMERALSPGVSTFTAVSLTLIATLLALGILEHWFLVLPLPDSALWKWALRPDDSEPGEALDDEDEGGDSGEQMTAEPDPAKETSQVARSGVARSPT
ncbi:putative photosynthetic complex assembly protein 2 [Thioflavicoccus mobilis 8321]|uniref:Putative photosynthetic complex assembly protein 2 n=1 Tax=Thioflavicoccus mobilis 8321 TaxID=765912 RepID=U3GL03_9GAMM|nr:putative photosynthetic complex assembly protein PuhE [Thioflavicoccus mobilis]AGA91707.1 putative photosynthetic complex assembly protein 2 [Thioflavicoccus mobilis 8321]